MYANRIAQATLLPSHQAKETEFHGFVHADMLYIIHWSEVGSEIGSCHQQCPHGMMLRGSALLGWHLETGLALLGIEVVNFTCRL